MQTQDFNNMVQGIDIPALVRDLTRVAKKHRLAPVQSLRRVVMAMGITPNPIGLDNGKTALPSTYRPVGVTCWSGCAYLGNGCFAEGGNVRLHQRRSGSELTRSLTSVAIGLVAAATLGTLCRLHVSGDFGIHDAVDPEYVTGVALVAAEVRRRFKLTEAIAFTYTHFTPEVFEPYRVELANAGVEVMYSDHAVAGGAMVLGSKWEGLAELRAAHPELTVAKCLAQTSDNTCLSCNKGTPLCAVARSKNILIVFAAHGSRTKVAEAKAREITLAQSQAKADAVREFRELLSMQED